MLPSASTAARRTSVSLSSRSDAGQARHAAGFGTLAERLAAGDADRRTFVAQPGFEHLVGERRAELGHRLDDRLADQRIGLDLNLPGELVRKLALLRRIGAVGLAGELPDGVDPHRRRVEAGAIVFRIRPAAVAERRLAAGDRKERAGREQLPSDSRLKRRHRLLADRMDVHELAFGRTIGREKPRDCSRRGGQAPMAEKCSMPGDAGIAPNGPVASYSPISAISGGTNWTHFSRGTTSVRRSP